MNNRIRILVNRTGSPPTSTADADGALFNACRRNDLRAAGALLRDYPGLNLSTRAFPMACVTGNLRVARWMLANCQNREKINTTEAFLLACFNNKLRIAKWLFFVDPSMDVGADNCAAFRGACYSGYADMARWLAKVTPGTYVDSSMQMF